MSHLKIIFAASLLLLTVGAETRAEGYSNITNALLSAGVEYAEINLEQNVKDLPKGFEREGNIVAAPNIRFSLYMKSYGVGEAYYALVGIGAYRDKVNIKIFQVKTDNKTNCMNKIIESVEYSQNQGLKG